MKMPSNTLNKGLTMEDHELTTFIKDFLRERLKIKTTHYTDHNAVEIAIILDTEEISSDTIYIK